MRLFVFLHVLAMFAAVAASYGLTIMLRIAAARRDVTAMRSVFAVASPVYRAIPIFFLLGLAFGLIAIFVGEFNPFAPWLIAAYVLFVIAMVLGAAVTAPWQARIAALATPSGESGVSPELETALRDPRSTMVFWVDLVLIVALIFVMVVKPLS